LQPREVAAANRTGITIWTKPWINPCDDLFDSFEPFERLMCQYYEGCLRRAALAAGGATKI